MALQRKVAVVAYDDGRVERYPITAKVEIDFEATRKTGVAVAFSGADSSTKLLQLAWQAMYRANQGQTILAFEQWVEHIEALDVELEPIVPFGSKVAEDTSQELHPQQV